MQLTHCRRRALLLAAALFVLALGGFPRVRAAPMWFADGSGVMRVDGETGQLLDRYATARVGQLAATAGGGAWLEVAGNVRYLAPGAATSIDVDVAALGYGGATRFAADPYDDSLWVVTGGLLLAHFDTHGRLLGGSMLPERAHALAVALDQSVWIAGERELRHLSTGADVLANVPIGTSWKSPIASIVVDSLRDRIWMAGEGTLAVVASDGPAPSIVEVGSEIRGSALDPKTGSLWLLTTAGLLECAAGAACASKASWDELDLADALSLAYDGKSDSLVVFSADAVRTLDRQGALHSGTVGSGMSILAAATPFNLVPGLTLVRPPAEANTFDRQPSFSVRFGPLCNGNPCTLPPEYIETSELAVSLDGESVASALRLDALSGQGEFTPAAPLAPGTSVFFAQALDRFGHRSNAIEARLTVLDSSVAAIAPKAGNQMPAVTLTAPANKAAFVPGANITLTATASDADGTIAKVEFYRGGATLLGTATSAPYTIVWSNVPAGSYALTAKATDNKNASKTSTAVNITVAAPPNAPPTIAITSPVNGAAVNGPGIVINVTASDSDGKVAKVDFFDGSMLLGSFAGGTPSVNATWTLANAAPGTHALKATATDNAGAAASASVSISVNAAPLVVVTSPANCASFDAPANLTLAADALDTDGTIMRIEFYQGTTLLGTASTAPYTLAWPGVAEGAYSLTAVAVDNLGARRTSTPIAVSVRPADAPPNVALTNPGDGSIFGLGAAIPMSATASDPDGKIAKVELIVGASVVGTAAAPPYTTVWTPAAAGNFTLTARATDDRGVATTSAAVHVSVVANKPPTVTLDAPDNSAVFIVPAGIDLAATATDADGTIAKVEFFANAKLVATSTASPYAATWANPAGGSYALTAKATDNLGASAVSAAVPILVDIPPVASLSPSTDNVSIAEGTPITFVVRGVDSDGTIYDTQLLMSQALTPPNPISFQPCYGASLYRDYSCTVTWTWAPPNVYTFTAKARDDHGAAAYSAPVHVTVNGTGAVALTAPATGASYAVPATIAMAANASESPGAIVKVEFFAGSTVVGTATSAPYAINWVGAPQGSYTLTARATDNIGRAFTSAPVSVSVDAVGLNIVSPSAGDTIYDSSVVVTGTFNAGVAATITVNGQAAALGNGTFAATVSLASGDNTITVVASAGSASANRSLHITRSAPQLNLMNLHAGDVIQDDSLTVQGTVSAPPNSAVIVDGQLAPIDAAGNFFVNNLALAAGSNTLTLTLNTPDGQSLQQTLDVTSTTLAPFALTLSPDHGMAPLVVSGKLANRNLRPYAGIAINDQYIPGGPTPPPEVNFTVTYATPGLHVLTLRVEDAYGYPLWETQRPIQVDTPGDLNTKLQGIYTGMLNRLRAGDIGGALTAVTDTVYDKYSAIFTALGPNLASIVDQLGTITDVTMGDDVAELAVVRNTPTGPQRFLIYLILGDDGIWRIEGM